MWRARLETGIVHDESENGSMGPSVAHVFPVCGAGSSFDDLKRLRERTALIAAAPEMFDALTAIREHCNLEFSGPKFFEAWQKLEQALIKATLNT